jgi:hypothetical protein
MAGEAGGAGSNSSHQLAAFRASQSLADAQAERTISSGDQQGVGEQHNRSKVKPADSRKATARSRTRSRACSSSANSSSPFAIISTGVDRVLDMLLSAKLESLAGELPPPECAEGGANPTESTDARASVTRVELTYQTAFYKSYLAAFARI